MKQLQGGLGIGAVVWLRGTVLVLAASFAVLTGTAQSIRLIPSTAQHLAGDGAAAPVVDLGQATTIALNAPSYVAVDLSGNAYISDTGNNCIRMVDTSGTMSVLAGQPNGASDTCKNAAGVTADYHTGVLQPSGIAVDGKGNLFVADTGHNCVRRLLAGSNGIAALQPLIGSCTDTSSVSVAPAPAGIAVDPSDNVYVAINDATDGIFQVVRSGPVDGYASQCVASGQTSAAVPTPCADITNPTSVTLNAPQGLALDPVGTLYIADSGNACVRAIANKAQANIAGACAANGTTLQKPVGVATDAAGYLYINDQGAAQVFTLAGTQLDLIAGTGSSGPFNADQDGVAAVTVPLTAPEGMTTDKAGNIYLADTGNNVVRVLTQGLNFPETTVGNSFGPQTLQFIITAAVKLNLTMNGVDFSSQGNTCNGTIAAPASGKFKTCQVTLNFKPQTPGLRTAALTLTDSSAAPAIYRFGLNGIGQRARAIFIPGTIKTLASALATPSAVAIDSAGDLYFAESGTGSGNGSVSELPAGSTTPVELIGQGMGIAKPTALALDAAGNLYVADATTNAVYRYDANGILTSFVGSLNNPVALAVDTLGDLYVAEDGATTDIREIYAGGQTSVIAGQGTVLAADNVLATTAKFVHPSALYLDPSGVLYVADRGAYLVYQIDTAGYIHIFAGNGRTTDSDPTSRTGTALPNVTGVSSDPAGDLYVADATRNVIFLAFSGKAQNPSMTILAGQDGVSGASGDNGPANEAELNTPAAVTVDGMANVFIADSGNGSLRTITYKDPTHDFGIVKINQTAGPWATTLWNAGNETLQPLQPVTIDDEIDFAVDAANTNCGGSLSIGGTCTLSYYATPKSYGSLVGHSPFSDSSVNPEQIVTLLVEVPKATLVAPNVVAVYGDSYTLTATVTGNLPSPLPTGSVTFTENGVALCPAVQLTSSGLVSCTPSNNPLLDVGVYPITVTYTGDSIYDGSTVSMTLTIVPRPVTITADNKTRPLNTPNPTLTGTVANVVPGQSIIATYSTTATVSSPVGSYPIVPAYTFGPGTKASNYAVTLVNGTLTVTDATPPPVTGSFTLAATPPEQEIDHSGTVNYVVSLTSTDGFTGPVTLACSGLPEGASCAFAPASVTLASGATGTSTMTITATADSTNVPTVFSKVRNAPLGGASPLLAWTMLPLGLFGPAGLLFSARRRRLLLMLLPFALLLAAAGMSGCAAPSNYKIYTVTVTGSGTSGGATITTSSTVDFVLAR
ncbi:MAG TPA: Ig-like domain repeat protein [Acidobacteriaceae bacterium]